MALYISQSLLRVGQRHACNLGLFAWNFLQQI